MKKFIFLAALAASISVFMPSCERVQPNYWGVLMENYGKNGKSDFSIQQGKVWTAGAGTELWQVPAWEQRGGFEEVMHLKTADNTEMTVKPTYSFTIPKEGAINVVFENKQLGSGEDFMAKLEDNILEMKIRDIIKEESRKYPTDTLMANSGSLKFEKDVEGMVFKEFEKKGVHLESLSCQLDFSDKVKEKIDTRNEVNTNLTVLDQQIQEQKKRNELAELKAQEDKIRSSGITPQILQQQFIQKWDGHTPLYGNTPITLMKPIP